MGKKTVYLILVVASIGNLLSQKTSLLETKYYSFQSNAQLNAHLYLYNRAMGCKFKKVQQDSLVYYSFKDKLKHLKPNDLTALNSVMLFYKDSLISRDVLMDSLMRDLCDHIARGTTPQHEWQLKVVDQLKIFQPFFNNLYWKEIEGDHKTWIKENKDRLLKEEVTVIPELERIFLTKLDTGKVIIDLTCYATWAGAFSYKDSYSHVIFCSTHGSNRGDLATEVVFHETSHFLIDKVEANIAQLTKGKNIRKTVNLWHNMIFYTTGYVLESQFSTENKKLVPYYIQMKFEDKFPDFKACIEACKLYWSPYIDQKSTMDQALKSIVTDITEK
jgi:hypothetical protein